MAWFYVHYNYSFELPPLEPLKGSCMPLRADTHTVPGENPGPFSEAEYGSKRPTEWHKQRCVAIIAHVQSVT